MRDIDNILYFRTDISPFLIHLTKEYGSNSAKDNLTNIYSEKKIITGKSPVSCASYGTEFTHVKGKHSQYFQAVSFTETPLSEIYCLFDIKNRSTELEPYGFVFLRSDLEEMGVSPVLYLNNENHEVSQIVCDLCKLIDDAPDTASKILPLLSFFGYHVPPFSNNDSSPKSKYDFRWEREWRYPATKGDFEFERNQIFLGLCPDEEIEYFENLFGPRLKFIDPTKNIRRYAEKLISVRQSFDLKYSIV